MSRSGYCEDIEDQWRWICWRGAVNSSLKGRRGQAFLRELAAALDAMPEKRLIGESLVTSEGDYCTLGVLGAARGIDLTKIDPNDSERVAKEFGIAEALAREVVFENDEAFESWKWVEVETCGPMRGHWEQRNRCIRVEKENVAELRWQHMRKWVDQNLIKS